ncbi:MAG: GNAT family N-acetyltransferase [Thermoanaerobaculia bacterium]
MTVPPATLSLRPATDEDLPFLRRVYASTRAAELEAVPWTSQEKERFLAFQFEAQHRDYRERFPHAAYDVVLADGEAVGRLYVDRRDGEIRLIDIALLPERRGRGFGSVLLTRLLAEAEASGLPVRIHVERRNPALDLYLRLGFRAVEHGGVYDLLEWRPAGPSP